MSLVRRRTSELRDSVPATDSKVIDTVALSDFVGLKYEMAFYNTVQNRTKTAVLSVGKRSGNVLDSVFNVLGDTIGISLNVTDNGTDMTLTVVNAESFDVDIHAMKFQLRGT